MRDLLKQIAVTQSAAIAAHAEVFKAMSPAITWWCQMQVLFTCPNHLASYTEAEIKAHKAAKKAKEETHD